MDNLQAIINEMSRAITELARQRQPVPSTSTTLQAGGGIPQFPKHHENENIEDFIVQFEGLASVHSYDESKKKASVLALLPPNTFQLLKNLIYPLEISNTEYTTLRDKLKEHLKPTPLRIPSRHALFLVLQHALLIVELAYSQGHNSYLWQRTITACLKYLMPW